MNISLLCEYSETSKSLYVWQDVLCFWTQNKPDEKFLLKISKSHGHGKNQLESNLSIFLLNHTKPIDNVTSYGYSTCAEITGRLIHQSIDNNIKNDCDDDYRFYFHSSGESIDRCFKTMMIICRIFARVKQLQFTDVKVRLDLDPFKQNCDRSKLSRQENWTNLIKQAGIDVFEMIQYDLSLLDLNIS